MKNKSQRTRTRKIIEYLYCKQNCKLINNSNNMKKTILIIFALIFLPVIAFSQCDYDKYSKLSYPEKFDDWKWSVKLNFEMDEPGEGISIDYSYNLDRASIELKIYNRTFATIEKKDLETEIDFITTDLYSRVVKETYTYVSPLKKLDSIVINDTITLSQYTYDFEASKIVYTTFLYFTALNNNFVQAKLIFSKSGDNILNKTAPDEVIKLYKKILECTNQ